MFEKEVKECCTTCKALNCKEKCECWTFATKGAEFGFNKANEWHDLRKNPDDLPKHSGLYCVQCGEVRDYLKEERSWFTVHFEPCMNRTEETYIWCEIPKYEGKK